MEIDERIHLQSYNLEWPQWFHDEVCILRSALAAWNLQFEHIGSTAIPHMVAKPIIDIMIGIRKTPPEQPFTQILTSHGYESLGEAGIPGRYYYRKRAIKSFNLALVQFQHALWTDNLVLRDYLRSHPSEAAAYSELKKNIFTKGVDHLLSYSSEKSPFIQSLLNKAKT